MHQVLHLAAFYKIKQRISRLQLYPAPKLLRHHIICMQMEIGVWQTKPAFGADQLLAGHQAFPAGRAQLRKQQRYKISQVGLLQFHCHEDREEFLIFWADADKVRLLTDSSLRETKQPLRRTFNETLCNNARRAADR